MGWGSKAGDLAFKGLAAGLGLTTIYLTATFSVNVYRGLAWHNAQSKHCRAAVQNQNNPLDWQEIEKQGSNEQSS